MRAADAAIGYVARTEKKPVTQKESAALDTYDKGQLNRPETLGLGDMLPRRVILRNGKNREENVD
jgi:hypothetical protein